MQRSLTVGGRGGTDALAGGGKCLQVEKRPAKVTGHLFLFA